MARVTVLYHSGSGHTERLARSIQRGAASVADTHALLVPALDFEKRWADLDASDALVFGCPTYMGSGSAAFKVFMEATSKRWSELKWKDKLAAGFTNSGSPSGDKLLTLQQLAIFAAQHGMVWLSLGMLTMVPSSRHEGELNNAAGAFLGLFGQSPAGAPDELAPSRGDLETGELFGVRVATAGEALGARWVRGASPPRAAVAGVRAPQAIPSA